VPDSPVDFSAPGAPAAEVEVLRDLQAIFQHAVVSAVREQASLQSALAAAENVRPSLRTCHASARGPPTGAWAVMGAAS
jgi:hypothetical protein